MYVSVSDIRQASRNLDSIVCAPDADIEAWGEEAQLVIDRFCNQSFAYESQTTRCIRADDYILYLDKIMSGDITVVSQTGEEVLAPETTVNPDGTTVLKFGNYWVFPGKNYFLYKNSNKTWPPPSDPRLWEPDLINITADWGFAPSVEYLLISLSNELKAKYQTHRVSAVYHQAMDIVNVVGSPDATDLASAITLLNELKVDISSHFLDLGFHCVAETETIDSAVATDLASAIKLAEELKDDFNLHISKWAADDGQPHKALDTEDRVFSSTSNPILPRVIQRVYIKLAKRLSIRESIDDNLQINSYYVSETTGDGYSYNLANGTMRNLLRPEDRELLWPFVNHGRVIV